MSLEKLAGNKALQVEEPLIFDLHAEGRCAVDWPEVEITDNYLNDLLREKPTGLPDLSEPQVIRHYTRLSQKNWGIDTGMYPLGSCTMKHNPRLNEKLARLTGFSDLHPFQPESTIQGALELMHTLSFWLLELTGMKAVALSPAAGAHGELCGMMCIKAALQATGEDKKRTRVLIPESAHGTNPATAVMCGFHVDILPEKNGRVDMNALAEKLTDDIAGIMLTNPNTCGLFEKNLCEISEAVHRAGGYVYCDGANFNAIVGRVRPGDLGIDAMHLNLHKTFSTPHGGGGPGSGPVVLSDRLAPFAPLPMVETYQSGYRLRETSDTSFGRMKAFHGQMGMFVRALSYMMSHGLDGLKQVSGDAVLNANYILTALQDVLHAPFPAPCMHECVFSNKTLKAHGIDTIDLAKALMDQGFYPMTVYFPLVVAGAMLIEPTESESKETLDQFIHTIRTLLERAKNGESAFFKSAPVYTPRTRLDETTAARSPVLCCPGVSDYKECS